MVNRSLVVQALMQPRSVLGSPNAAEVQPQLVHPTSRTLAVGQLVVLRMPAASTEVPVELDLGKTVYCDLQPVPDDQQSGSGLLYVGCWDVKLASPCQEGNSLSAPKLYVQLASQRRVEVQSLEQSDEQWTSQR